MARSGTSLSVSVLLLIVAARGGPRVECDDDMNACEGKGEHCENGHCVGPDRGGPGCRELGSPSFELDSLELGLGLAHRPQGAGDGSLRSARRERTQHGPRRAASAKDFLLTLGVGSSM